MQRINVYAIEDDLIEDDFHDGYGYDPHIGYRQPAKPELAGWFDLDKATKFHEDTEWDGSNHISVATGSQWDHEMLIRTAQGRWVLNTYSNRQGVMETYRFISDNDAREWLLRNDGDREVRQYFGEIEEERGPGRPSIGEQVCFTVPADVLAELDAQVERENSTRSALLRRATIAFVAAGKLATETTEEPR